MRAKHYPGFTLIELLVTISIAAVLLAMAVPGFVSTINRSRLSGAANELVASLQYARSEAIKRNLAVTVCRSDDQATCSAGSGPWPGWIVVVADGNGDGNANDPDVLQTFRLESPLQLRSSLAGGRVGYRADGFARADGAARGAFLNARFDLCIPTARPTENLRRVRMVSGGRLSTDALSGGGACN